MALGSTPTVITLTNPQTIGTLNLTGTGALSLAGSALTVINTVAVAGGQTLSGTATLNAAVALGSGGTLTGTPSVGALTATGATLTPGTVGTAGTITATGLSATGANTFNFDIGTAGDLINVTGNISALSGTVALNPIAGYAAGATYTLFQYGGTLTGGVGGLTLNTSALPTGGLNAYYSYSLDAATSGQINIVASRAAQAFTWTGAGSDTNWTTGANWNSGVGLSPVSVDTAVFSLTESANQGTTRTVTLGGNQAVNAMNFTSDTPYTFDLSGSSNVLTVCAGGISDSDSGLVTFNNILAGSTTINVYGACGNIDAWAWTFLGSELSLANTGNTFSGAINVYGGQLDIAGSGALGNSSNVITLGSAGQFGRLNGSGTLVRNLVLAGSGGWLRDFSTVTGSFSGSGSLIISDNTMTVNPSVGNTLYSGTTHVWANVYFGAANGTVNVLGSGNLRVEYFGHAYLYTASVISPSAAVFVGGYDTNTEFWASSTRSVLGVYSDFMPNITSDSGGDFNIDCTTTNGGGGAIATALAYNPANPNKVLGNGYMSIGSDNGGVYQGASLIADADNVYRFDVSGGGLTLNSWGSSNGVLNDNGGNQCGVYVTGGSTLDVSDSNNTYTGTTTIDQASTLQFDNLSTTAGQSPMGASTGNIVLVDNAQLTIKGSSSSQVAVVKNDLTFNGTGRVTINANGHPTALQLTSLTRGWGNSVLTIYGQSGQLGASTGNYEQVTVSTNPPVSSGGMVSPVCISGAYNGFFLDYGPMVSRSPRPRQPRFRAPAPAT